MLDLTAQVNAVAARIYPGLEAGPRQLIAIGGPPGSGKSTLAAELARRLNAQRIGTDVVALDGFRLDNAVLDARGLRPRKGAPETFDADGFVIAVRRLRRGDTVVMPVFDRARDLAVAGALVVAAETRVVICEGSYLLFDASPWAALRPLWDLAVQMTAPLPDLRARLIQRWLDLGLSRAAATRRVETTDLANVQRVLEHTVPADLVLASKAL